LQVRGSTARVPLQSRIFLIRFHCVPVFANRTSREKPRFTGAV